MADSTAARDIINNEIIWPEIESIKNEDTRRFKVIDNSISSILIRISNMLDLFIRIPKRLIIKTSKGKSWILENIILTLIPLLIIHRLNL
jgi:hypothetical protein